MKLKRQKALPTSLTKLLLEEKANIFCTIKENLLSYYRKFWAFVIAAII